MTNRTDIGDIEEQVLALAGRTTEQAEVFSLSSAETPVRFEANRLKQLQTRQTRGLALRVVVGGRVGLASTTRLDDPQALVATALSMAAHGAAAAFTLPSAGILPQVDVYDAAVERLAVDSLVDFGQRLVDRVRSFESNVLCDADVSTSVTAIRVLNSLGCDSTFSKTVLSASLHGNLVRGTDMLDVYEEMVSCRAGLALDDLAERVIHKIRLSGETAGSATGELPVVFTPKGVAMTLMAPLRAALSGRMVVQGASPLGDKLGQTVADARFSLWDDGLVAWAPGSGPCDHEGVACRRTPLIDAGRVAGFYYDLQTAGQAGVASTANGFRSLDSLPAPSPSSLVIGCGDAALESIIAGLSDGIIVDQTMGAWSGNLISGEFSGNVHLGWRVSGGSIVGRVKDTMVAGNIYDALNRLAAIGGEAEWVGDVLTPALAFHSLSFATK